MNESKNDITRNDDMMTRYRQKTRRGIIIFLAHEGASTLKEISEAIGRDERVTRNYLRYFSDDFEARGIGKSAKWRTTRTLTQRGRSGIIEIE